MRTRYPRNARPAGGAMVPVLCLVVGLVLGLAGGIVPRFFNIDPMNYIKPPKPDDAKPAEAAAPEVAAPVMAPNEIELRSLLADVKKQKAALAEREKPLAAREAQIEQQRKTLEDLKQQIDKSEADLKRWVVEMKGSEVKNIKRIANVWALMEPAEVVPLVQTMDIELVTKVLATMPEERTAALLGAMTAPPATAATSKLAADLVGKLKSYQAAAATKTQ